MTRVLKWALTIWAVISFAVAVYDLVTGGFRLTILGLRVSSFEAYKPFRNGIACACAALWLHDRDRPGHSWWDRLRGWSPPLSAAAACILLVVALRFGVRAAGGSDAYGYVSQVALWSSGRLIVPEQLAAFGRALGIVTAPLGYRAAPVAGSSVPTYSAGYPLMMVVAQTIAGPSAVYVVVPLCGGAIVFLTYLVGARFAGPRTGFVAALLMACSPILLFQSFEPMSDVPVTMWFMLAWWLALGETTAAVAGAGLATAAAILTRPNLAPLAVLLLAFVMRTPPRITRGAVYALATLPGALAVAAINQYLFGTPLMSGYGPLSLLYEWNNVGPNLQRYPVWLVQLHTPAILIALAAPFISRREPDAAGARADTRSLAVWMLAFSVALLLSYLFYGVFEAWPYLRFLLPAIPLLFVLGSNVLVTALHRIPVGFRGAAVFTVCVLLGTWCFKKSAELGVYDLQLSEQRYEAIGRYVGHRLPSNAVIISVIESGSVRMYGNRITLRWDEIPKSKLDQTIDVLRSSGYSPYILLEDWEEPMFRRQFGDANLAGRVDWPPAFESVGAISVRIYDPDDRRRFVAGERWLPQMIPRG